MTLSSGRLTEQRDKFAHMRLWEFDPASFPDKRLPAVRYMLCEDMSAPSEGWKNGLCDPDRIGLAHTVIPNFEPRLILGKMRLKLCSFR